MSETVEAGDERVILSHLRRSMKDWHNEQALIFDLLIPIPNTQDIKETLSRLERKGMVKRGYSIIGAEFIPIVKLTTPLELLAEV